MSFARSEPLDSIPEDAKPYEHTCIAGHLKVHDGYDKKGVELWHCERPDCGAGVRAPLAHAELIEQILEDEPTDEVGEADDQGETTVEVPTFGDALTLAIALSLSALLVVLLLIAFAHRMGWL